jgi:hypothetical protein
MIETTWLISPANRKRFMAGFTLLSGGLPLTLAATTKALRLHRDNMKAWFGFTLAA